jgi:E3 ubiquitin-protein ligase BAH
MLRQRQRRRPPDRRQPERFPFPSVGALSEHRASKRVARPERLRPAAAVSSPPRAGDPVFPPCCRAPVAHADTMKFGATYEEYLRLEQDKYLGQCSRVEYKRLKKVLKKCRVGRSLQVDGANGDEKHQGSDEYSDVCECNSCTLCDEMFFTELNKEASEIAGCFRSRVQRLLHLHVPSGLQRYIWRFRQCFIDDQQIMVQEGRMLLNYVTMNAIAIRKILKKYDKIHGSVSGRDFRSKMQTEHTELLQSPWLIELGAFHLNCDDSDTDELGAGGFFKNGFFKNFSCDLTGAQPLLTMTISETLKYEYSLTCSICLVRYSFSVFSVSKIS